MRTVGGVASTVDLLRGLRRRYAPSIGSPQRLAAYVRERPRRVVVERALSEIPTIPSSSRRRVLVDAMWDNPNYWYRFALMRAAIGLSGEDAVGVLGMHRSVRCRDSLRSFGIISTSRLRPLVEAQRFLPAARTLLRTVRRAEDLLALELPCGFPADVLYDGVLKRQRTAVVDVQDDHLPWHIAEALAALESATRVLDARPLDLLLMSHAIDFHYASLAWLALQRRIPIIVMFGLYGVPRYCKLTQPEHLYDTADCPEPGDIAALGPSVASSLAAVGREYLERRRAGQTTDLGAQYAFARGGASPDRKALCDQFGWDTRKPIVAVYPSNWFDYPHSFGMTQFRDFLDWTEATLAQAERNRSVNWLFRGHPCDAWYGGVTLSDLINHDTSPHIRQCPVDWSGAAVMNDVDALVTYHSTAAIEYAAFGKPVLVSDRSWYHGHAFVHWPGSREAYLQALNEPWWEGVDIQRSTDAARIFAGWYFGHPAWQDDFLMLDDSAKNGIYNELPAMLEQKPQLSLEVQTLRSWTKSDSRKYHTYKMGQAIAFAA